MQALTQPRTHTACDDVGAYGSTVSNCANLGRCVCCVNLEHAAPVLRVRQCVGVPDGTSPLRTSRKLILPVLAGRCETTRDIETNAPWQKIWAETAKWLYSYPPNTEYDRTRLKTVRHFWEI